MAMSKDHPQAQRPELKPSKHPKHVKPTPPAPPAQGAQNPLQTPPSGNVGPSKGGQAPPPNPMKPGVC